MFSRPVAFILLALGCVTAAAGGAYVANRHNWAEVAVATVPAPAGAAAAPTGSMGQAPVAEIEAAVSGATSEPPAAVKAEKVEPAPVVIARRPEAATPKSTPAAPKSAGNNRNEPAVGRTVPMAGTAPVTQPQPEAAAPYVPAPVTPAPVAEPAKPAEVQLEAPRPVQFEEVILPRRR